MCDVYPVVPKVGVTFVRRRILIASSARVFINTSTNYG